MVTTSAPTKGKEDASSSPSSSSLLWSFIAFPLCLSWRIWLSNRMPIMDCDEVYNYWEPLHFLLYGSGMQTWEYAHEFALRTYAYLTPLVALSRIYEWLLSLLSIPVLQSIVPLLLLVESSPVTAGATVTTMMAPPKFILFLLLRSSLAAWMAYAEVQFCRALEVTRTVTPPVARWTLVVLQTSAGLAHASGALLPSTAWTVAWLLAATRLLRRQSRWFVIYAVGATLAIGWPFGVLVLVPLGLYVLVVQTVPIITETESTTAVTSSAVFGSAPHIQNVKQFLMFIVAVTTIIQGMVLVIDYQYYGSWTSPNLNIFRYNAQGGGDELYGVEPLSYYIKNLLLNFNGVAVLGVVSLGAVALEKIIGGYNNDERGKALNVLLVLLAPMYVWFAIVVPRPHKEERFLFPIYPMLCLGAVLTLDALHSGFFALLDKLLSSSSQIKFTPTHRSILHGIVWIPVAALSMLRILALKNYYAAPLSIYAALHSTSPTTITATTTTPSSLSERQQQQQRLVCTCGEWYRFPSSFTLPANHELAFLPSSFRGQLPQPFSQHGSLAESRSVLQPFNDRNQHEATRYSTLEDCSYVIDLQESTDCQVPSSAQVIATLPFLDADKTTSTLHRTLYIPILHEQGISEGTIHYQNYILYKL